MLYFLDILLTGLHLVIILFNLFGWIPVHTRKANLISVLLTAASWFLLGIWFGIGYCPITEWQWNIKEQLGEKNLPNSFIKYYGDKITGKNLSSTLIDTVTTASFAFALIMSLYVNFFKRNGPSNNLNKKAPI